MAAQATERAYIGLGANLGDAPATLASAYEALGDTPGIALAARSSVYRSAPLGYAHQPDFFNVVAGVDTALGPLELLRSLQSIERRFGRTHSFKDAPRTLDLDFLLYGSREINQPALQVPHPRMHERAFVLLPLVEIAPDIVIPGQPPVRVLLDRVTTQKISKVQ